MRLAGSPFCSPHGNDRILAQVNGGHAGKSCGEPAGLRGVGPAFRGAWCSLFVYAGMVITASQQYQQEVAASLQFLLLTIERYYRLCF
jgi:hypothetical protein